MSQSDLLLRRCRNFIVNNAVFDSATEILAELDAHLAQPEAAEPDDVLLQISIDPIAPRWHPSIIAAFGFAICRANARLKEDAVAPSPVAVRGRPEYGGKYGDLHKTMRLSHQGPVAAQPTDREQSEGICKEADGCPTEMAVLKRFWRAHHAAQSDVLANLDWERLRSGAYRALDPEHQDVFDMIAALRERGGK